jgi:hypothetical protein
MTYLAPNLYQSPNTRFQNDVNLAMDLVIEMLRFN